jgi:hypothetical protein
MPEWLPLTMVIWLPHLTVVWAFLDYFFHYITRQRALLIVIYATAEKRTMFDDCDVELSAQNASHILMVVLL